MKSNIRSVNGYEGLSMPGDITLSPYHTKRFIGDIGRLKDRDFGLLMQFGIPMEQCEKPNALQTAIIQNLNLFSTDGEKPDHVRDDPANLYRYLIRRSFTSRITELWEEKSYDGISEDIMDMTLMIVKLNYAQNAAIPKHRISPILTAYDKEWNDNFSQTVSAIEYIMPEETAFARKYYLSGIASDIKCLLQENMAVALQDRRLNHEIDNRIRRSYEKDFDNPFDHLNWALKENLHMNHVQQHLPLPEDHPRRVYETFYHISLRDELAFAMMRSFDDRIEREDYQVHAGYADLKQTGFIGRYFAKDNGTAYNQFIDVMDQMCQKEADKIKRHEEDTLQKSGIRTDATGSIVNVRNLRL